MMHVLAVTIFLGAFALSMSVIAWMLSANRGKILAALLGDYRVATEALAPLQTYTPRSRLSVTFPGIPQESPPVMQRLAA